MVAITPQIQSLNSELVSKLNLNFDVLYDEDNQYARSLDLVDPNYTARPEPSVTLEHVKSLG